MDRSMPVAAGSPLAAGFVRAIGLVAGALAAALIFPWVGMNAGLTVQPSFAWLDPDDAFVFITVHHLVQGGLAIVLIGLLVAAGWSWREFGFARGNAWLALRVVAVFTLVYGILTFGYDFLPYAVAGNQPGLSYFFTPTNVLGVLAFEWLLVGLSEEVLFRGLILGVLTRVFGGTVRIGMGRAAFRVTVAGIVTAVTFAFAHTIIYSRVFFLPFAFEPNWLQVIQAFILGIYYAALCERTGSLLGSIVSHNISDGLYMSMIFLAVAFTI
jgi:membrane protease YdiL (CAAX protease family)